MDLVGGVGNIATCIFLSSYHPTRSFPPEKASCLPDFVLFYHFQQVYFSQVTILQVKCFRFYFSFPLKRIGFMTIETAAEIHTIAQPHVILGSNLWM